MEEITTKKDRYIAVGVCAAMTSLVSNALAVMQRCERIVGMVTAGAEDQKSLQESHNNNNKNKQIKRKLLIDHAIATNEEIENKDNDGQ